MKLKGTVLLSFLFLCVGGIFFSRKTKASTHTKTIKVVCDSHFSQTMQERLSLFAQEQEKVSTSPALLSQVLKEAFPCVKDVSIRSSRGSLAIMVSAHTPLFQVNSNRVFLKNGGVSNSSDFIKSDVNVLPKIAFSFKGKTAHELSPEVQRWSRGIDYSLFENHEVCWYDDSYVMFKDKNFKNISLIGASTTEFSQEMLASCEVIKKNIMEKRVTKGRKWLIDVRFKNQIVAFWQPGGKV